MHTRTPPRTLPAPRLMAHCCLQRVWAGKMSPSQRRASPEPALLKLLRSFKRLAVSRLCSLNTSAQMERLEPHLFIAGIHSTQPPEYPHPSWAHSSSAAAQHCPTSSPAQDGLGIWYFILPCLGRVKHRRDAQGCSGLGKDSRGSLISAINFFVRKRKSRLFLAFGSAGLVRLMCWPSR